MYRIYIPSRRNNNQYLPIFDIIYDKTKNTTRWYSLWDRFKMLCDEGFKKELRKGGHLNFLYGTFPSLTTSI